MRVSENVIDVLFCGKLKHLTRFSIVGILNTLIDFFVFSMLQGVFGVNYVFSQFLGYSSGIANSFILNKNLEIDGWLHNFSLSRIFGNLCLVYRDAPMIGYKKLLNLFCEQYQNFFGSISIFLDLLNGK